jgi:hypothetical protein
MPSDGQDERVPTLTLAPDYAVPGALLIFAVLSAYSILVRRPRV